MPNQPSKTPRPKTTPGRDTRSAQDSGLPVRDTVLFPHAVLPLTVGRESSIQLIESLGEERTIVLRRSFDPRAGLAQAGDLHAVGTLATVHKVVRMPNQSRFVFTEGVERVRLLRYSRPSPSWWPRWNAGGRRSRRPVPALKRWCAT
jgi:ATP-dependent Lon protease